MGKDITRSIPLKISSIDAMVAIIIKACTFAFVRWLLLKCRSKFDHNRIFFSRYTLLDACIQCIHRPTCAITHSYVYVHTNTHIGPT